MSTRLKQVLILLVGVVGALVMVFLGLWQMQVFVDKGNKTVEDRAAQAAVPLDPRSAPYSRWGDWLGLSCLAVVIGIVPAGLIRRRIRPLLRRVA